MKQIILDEKVTIWVRRTCEIHDDVTEEEIMEQVKNNTVFDSENIEVLSNDFLFDTEEPMLVENNGGESTLEYVELKQGNYNVISDNSEG